MAHAFGLITTWLDSCVRVAFTVCHGPTTAGIETEMVLILRQ